MYPWILAALTAIGCATQEKPTRQLSERERNEAIARSVLPGAAGVGGALRVADSAAARSQRLQIETSSADSPPSAETP
jgi:hypothetical protein